MNILLWNGRTHLMNNTHELSEIKLQGMCTLRFNWSNKWWIRFKSRLFCKSSEFVYVVRYTRY